MRTALLPALMPTCAAAQDFTTLRYTCDRGVTVPATYVNGADQSLVVIHVDGNQITLVFFRELFCAQLYSRHFRKGMLEMKEPCPLPEQLAADLGINGTSLLAGTYRIQESEGCFRVEVDCGNLFP